MNVLNSYIVKEILKASFIAMLVFLTLYNLFTFSDELRDMGEGNYGLKEIVFYLALTTPGVFYQLVPSAALLGSLFVLGGMANNRELVIMRAAGISILGIIRPVMYAAGIIILFSFLIGEFLAPYSGRTAQLIRVTAQEKQAMAQTKYGFWMKDENTIINVRRINDNGELADISIYEIDENFRLKRTSHADLAKHIGGSEWMLKQIMLTELGGDELVASEVEEKTWKSALEPDFLNVVMVKPESLSIFDLGKYIEFLKENGQESSSFELAFWGRFISPVTTLAMVLIAVPFVIRVHRNMSVGYRITAGAIFGSGFYILDKIIGNVGLVYHFDPMLMAVLPSILVFSVVTLAISALR